MSELEHVAQLSNKESDFSLCIICQKRQGGAISDATEAGLTKLREAVEVREANLDLQNAAVTSRIKDALSNPEVKIRYHRTKCYGTYTHKKSLSALSQKSAAISKAALPESSCEPKKPVLRSQLQNGKGYDKTLCICCQQETSEALRKVLTFNMRDTLLDLAKYDDKLHIRTSGICLIADDALYHSTCIILAQRRKQEILNVMQKSSVGMAISKLCYELQISASKGQVLQLDAVWNRYKAIAKQCEEEIPHSFVSRRSTFKEKLQAIVGHSFFFYQPLDRAIDERNMLLIPTKDCTHFACKPADDDSLTMPSYTASDENLFRSMVHVALSLRKELQEMEGLRGLRVSNTSAQCIIPENLNLFLNILVEGQEAVDKFFEEGTEPDSEEDDDYEDSIESPSHKSTSQRVNSIAQDIVYVASKGKKWTPKHIGLALTMHQQTRSRRLVTLLNKAGHCLSYEQLLRVDTTLAEETLKSIDPVTGAIVPPNLKLTTPEHPSLIHFAADNMDLITDTIDGKNSFHVTQMVAYQRGAQSLSSILDNLDVGQKTTLCCPPVLSKVTQIGPVPMREPFFPSKVELEWYKSPTDPQSVELAQNKDLAFIFSRNENPTSWTEFNKNISTTNPELSAVGYMPLILQPAHEYNTLCTVLERCRFVSEALGQSYAVLTVDQDLYHRIMEIKWAHPDRFSDIVVKMGGLHVAMNFQRAIGQHMENSGLAAMWIESGLLAINSTKKSLEGKAYAKAMRAHKITFQALWRLLLPQLLDYLMVSDPYLYQLLLNLDSDPDACATTLSQSPIQDRLAHFVQEKSDASENFCFWWSYLEMVSFLLMFVRAMRDGDWDLKVSAMTLMLPYIARYDHLNYLKSMSIYIAEMRMLPEEVLERFRAGEFAVKRTDQKFNMVDGDHAQEWLVNTGKSAGGVRGITNEDRSLHRWALSFHTRSYLTEKTYEMFDIKTGCNTHIDLTPGRKARDIRDESNLLDIMKECKMFSWTEGAPLQNSVTKDIAPIKVKQSLLSAKSLGQEKVDNFVAHRLVIRESGKAEMSFHDVVHKESALTFKDLFKKPNKKPSKKITVVDRNVMKRIIFAYEAGRPVDLPFILQHELMDIPVSLAKESGVMKDGKKAPLMNHLISDTICPNTIPTSKSAHLIIDAQAMIHVLGRPAELSTFGDMVSYVADHLKKRCKIYKRIDVVFDRYNPNSIKEATRDKRSSGLTPVRRIVEGRQVPLPKNWPNFLALSDNKADFAKFLSTELSKVDFGESELVLAGGFENPLQVFSSKGSDISNIRSNHEEADTRMVLHAISSQYERVVVSATDTDVFLLLLSHFSKMKCKELWMMAGTSKKRKFIPIHDIHAGMEKAILPNLLAFHAVTGCDVTSYIEGISKPSACALMHKVKLLSKLGKVPLTEKALRDAEEFIVSLYKLNRPIKTADAARYCLFGGKKSAEQLPPTSDALRLHLKWAHLQTFIWENAHIPEIQAPKLTDCGWKIEDGKAAPIWTTKGPVPDKAVELIYCQCSTPCRTNNCGCRKKNFQCAPPLCQCPSTCINVEKE